MPIAVTILYTISAVESFNDSTTNVTYTLSHDDVDLTLIRTDQFFTDQLTYGYDVEGTTEDNTAILIANFERLASRQLTSFAASVRRKIEQAAAATIAPSSEQGVSGLSLIVNQTHSVVM